MTDGIFYNFDSNHASLDDIQTHMNGINEAKDDIAHVFTMLGQHYDGEGADQLQAHHGAIHQQLDNHMNERMSTHLNAGRQQDAMQQLDRANAAQF